MSYQVMARKWRPQAFHELVGQKHVSQTLLNGLRSNRLAHALLFTGPRGTGKTSTARILAKAVRCPNAVDYVPCHTCGDCLDIAAGRSLDVIEIDGASHNGVDAVRELRDSVGFMPSTGKFKIYIIDEVHMLSTAAFNALLKTLEEPPAHVIFVLATTEIHKIPNTILSRCQRLDFRRIPAREVVAHLTTICEREEIPFEEEALWAVAKQAEGSMRDSQSLLDQVITFNNKRLTAAAVAEALGLSDRVLLNDTLQMLVQSDQSQVVGIVSRLLNSGLEPKVFVQDLLVELRNLLIVKISEGRHADIIDRPETEIDQLRSLGETLSPEDIHLLFDMTLKGASDVARASDPQLVLEMLLFRMVAAPRIEFFTSSGGDTPGPRRNPTAAAPRQAPSLAKKLESTPPATTPETASGPAETAPEALALVPTDLPQDQRWFELVQRVQKSSPFLGAKLSHLRLLKEDPANKKLIAGIQSAHKFLFDQLQAEPSRSQIDALLGQHWGPDYRLELQLGEDMVVETKTPQEIAEQIRRDRAAQIREQVESHPMIRAIREVNQAEIKSIKELR